MLPALSDVRRGSDFAALRRVIAAAGLLERPAHQLHGAHRAHLPRARRGRGAWWSCSARPGGSSDPGRRTRRRNTQFAFLGHEAGISRCCGPAAPTTLGIVAGNLLVGLSYGWWLDKHNRHHANAESRGTDPDIGEWVLAFTTAQVAARTGGPAGSWRVTRPGCSSRCCARGPELHVASVRVADQGPARRYRRTEMVLLSVHTGGIPGRGRPDALAGRALAFVAVHQAVFGMYMGCRSPRTTRACRCSTGTSGWISSVGRC